MENGIVLDWKLPEDTEHYGGYTVTMYYNRIYLGDDTPWRRIGSACLFFDDGDCSINSRGDAFLDAIKGSILKNNGNRAGVYTFTVQAMSDNVTKANHSPESEMSVPCYFNGKL